MTRDRRLHLARLPLFALALLVSVHAREFNFSVLDQAVMWLPSGAAIAGLWLLGLRASWVVALCSVAGRIAIGYDLSVAVPAGLGSAAEAVVGVLILRRLSFRPQLARQRDVLAIAAVAAVAPLASILCSWLARSYSWTVPGMPFYSGWDGWWRMNALGVLTIVPVATVWLTMPRPGRRDALRVGIIAVMQGALAALVMLAGPDGFVGIMLLDSMLLVALYAGVRSGPRGAVTAGSLAAVFIALATASGLGPFLDVDMAERHLALQLFELQMVGLPLLFGAQVAERRSAETERARSAEDLVHNRELLASIHRNVNEGVYRSLPDGTLIYVNEAFARLFGYDTPESILPVNANDLHDEPERREQLKGVITRQDIISNEEVRFRRRDGSAFWGLVSSSAIRGPDGEVACYDGAITDVTAWKSVEEQLRQAQRLESVGQMAGGIAHDFNNMLTAIVGYNDLVRTSVGPGDPVREYSDGILRASERAAALTHQLLAYSRRQMLSPQELELGATVEHLGDMLRRLIGDDIRLLIDTVPGGCWARVDRSQFEQVIVNLVVNARDAMPAGGTVTISLKDVGTHIVLAVRDTGTGMPDEVKARAFDPFFTTKARGKGTGLGLSTVYGIVMQSGGEIAIDSRPGQGTAVSIRLPRVEAAEEPEISASAPPQRHEHAAATIVFAEDEPEVRDLTTRVLEQAGYTVLAAADGQAALELCRQRHEPIDLLLTDVVMPRLGGRDLAARLLAERPGLRVLFVSGYIDDAGDLCQMVGPAGDFLQKPFQPEQLVACVRRLLARAVTVG